MKKYKVHLKNARDALNAGNVDAYKRGISALIRSAPSMKSRSYLIDELAIDGFFIELFSPLTADTISIGESTYSYTIFRDTEYKI